MKNSHTQEIITAIVLVALAISLLNPFHFWMPGMMLVAVLALALVVFAFFASFILKERSFDEREESHRTLAGRVAFLVGSGVTILGITVGALQDHVDPWLVAILSAMVIAKIGTRFWIDRNS